MMKQASSTYESVRSADEKVVLVWKDLSFQTVAKDSRRSTFLNPVYNTRHILRGLSGRAESKQLIAIMGPTGCGKTSLLNVLAARFPTGGSNMSSLTGSIYLNGKPRDEEGFRKISAYVMQDDNMYAHLTVYETLTLSAHFFLSSTLSDERKSEIVMGIIQELGLIKAKDTIIGNEKVRGVSGGERKRVSIAVQLLTDPAVLFLDEPTSGLDAFQSQAVMEVLKNLALKGRLVVSVIHQPRSSIYSMFDQLLMLSEGHSMYFGPAHLAVGYFGQIGFTCPEHFNPADYFLDLLSPDSRSEDLETETRQRIRLLSDHFQTHTAPIELHTKSTAAEEFVSIQTIGGEADLQRTVRSFLLLCWRSWTEQARNLPVIFVKFFSSLFFALVIGGIFSGTGYDQIGIQNRRGVLYFNMINQGFAALTAVLATFPDEKVVINRERAGNSYTMLAYCMAKIFVEMPLNLLPVVVYCVIIHPLVGLNPDTFGYYILISLFINLTIIVLGLAISAFAPNADAAAALGPPFLIIGVLFGGFYVKVDTLPIVLNWIPFISLFQWGFRGLCINEFAGETFSCDVSPDQCTLTGEEVLRSLDFHNHTIEYAMFGLGMLLLCYLCGLYLLLLINEQRFLRLGHVGARYQAKSTPEEVGEKALQLTDLEGRAGTYQLLYIAEPGHVQQQDEGSAVHDEHEQLPEEGEGAVTVLE